MSSPLDSPNWSGIIWANRPLRPRGHHRVALLDGQLGGWSPSECMRRILDPLQSSTEETVCFLQELTSNDEAGGVELSSLSDCSIRASCWVVRTSRVRFSQHVHRKGMRDSSSSTPSSIYSSSICNHHLSTMYPKTRCGVRYSASTGPPTCWIP